MADKYEWEIVTATERELQEVLTERNSLDWEVAHIGPRRDRIDAMIIVFRRKL